MKKFIVALIYVLILMPFIANARDDVNSYSIENAFASEEFQEKLGTDIRFFFGEQSPGEVLRTFGEYRTNKKSNAFGKSDQKVCEWAFLSALITLRDRAIKEGGNAVIGIESNYKNNRTSSETEFNCGAGAFVAGVALIGTVVTIN